MGHKDMRAAITSGVKEAVNQLVECDRLPTLRDYFAAQALTGILSDLKYYDSNLESPFDVAKFAYEYADAMLAAREKKAEAA
jgi:oligoendopeptidase F